MHINSYLRFSLVKTYQDFRAVTISFDHEFLSYTHSRKPPRHRLVGCKLFNFLRDP